MATQFVTVHQISKTQARRARSWLYNRGLLSKYDSESKTFSVVVTKYGEAWTIKAMMDSLAPSRLRELP